MFGALTEGTIDSSETETIDNIVCQPEWNFLRYPKSSTLQSR